MSSFGVTAAVIRAPMLFLLFTSFRLSPCPLYAPIVSSHQLQVVDLVLIAQPGPHIV